ncbi:12313_t:CDS:2 [Cetraspora pellucida]|uniref:12313_t:CDS:1 n=1 Tax=Cetraspora pellucida TaxID=1433469 RepID=A0A9N8WNV5_9GLOM|nr:12313_t:CDS:2 [Cetraspora pellucida]
MCSKRFNRQKLDEAVGRTSGKWCSTDGLVSYWISGQGCILMGSTGNQDETLKCGNIYRFMINGHLGGRKLVNAITTGN